MRVPPKVKEFLRENGFNPRHILEDFCSQCRKNKLPKLREELKKAEESVLQLRQNVIQLEHENDIKIQENVESVVKYVLLSFNPDYYIGKTYDGVKITKNLLDKYRKEGL